MMPAHPSNRSFRIFPLIVLFASFVSAQPRSGESPADGGFTPVAVEAFSLPLSDTSRANIVLQYRIPRSFFALVRTSDPKEQEPFQGRGEISVELMSRADTIAGRMFRPLRILQSTGIPAGEQESLEGYFAFDVPKGAYYFQVEVRDNQSDRQFSNRKLLVPPLARLSSGMIVSSPLFIGLPRAQSDLNGVPFLNSGGAVLFGNPGTIVLSALGIAPSTSLNVRWSLVGKPFDDLSICAPRSGTASTVSAGMVQMNAILDRPMISIDTTSTASRTIIIPLSFEAFEPGTYDLLVTVTAGTDSIEIKRTFPVVWMRRPLILTRLETAYEALRHIASDEEMNALLGASSSSALTIFRDFWRKRSPDTSRALNPAMAEYYRRVDESIRRFSVTGELNGFKTDRGRIFILFGSPSSETRTLKPGQGPVETWTYIRARKRFIFEDRDRNGSFALTTADEW